MSFRAKREIYSPLLRKFFVRGFLLTSFVEMTVLFGSPAFRHAGSFEMTKGRVRVTNKTHENKTEDSSILSEKISRRTFVDWIIKGGIFTTLAGMLLPALSYLWPVMGRGPSMEMEEVGRVEDIPVWGSKKVIVGGSALLLIRTPKDFKAYSAICTHLGCIVDWDGRKQEIVCPCHAGIFDIEGRVVTGPPPKPLPFYQVNVADGKIFVKI